MLTNTPQIRQGASQACRRGLRKQFAGTAAMALCLAAIGGAAHAEAPAAGAIIGNQAIATFSDGFETRSVTSNLVQTEINQIYAVDIEADQTKVASVDGLITFPHNVTNIGNGADSFSLEVLGDSAADFNSITIYADANNDGVPDSATPLTATPILAPGESFGIVLEVDLSATTTAASTPGLRVAATSEGAVAAALPGAELIGAIADGTTDVAWQDANDDDLTISAGPILDLTKGVTFAPGGDVDGSGTFTPGDILTFRLTYSNSQPNTNATAFIVDDLDLPNSTAGATADLTYVTDSVVWSDGALAASSDVDDEFTEGVNSFGTPDATNGSGEQIDVFYDSGTNQIQVGVDINSGTVTREGYVEFNVVIGDLAAGTPINVATIEGQNSNQVPIPIAADDAIAVVLNDVASSSALYTDRSVTDLADTGGTWAGGGVPASSTDDGVSSADDIIEEGTPVAEGSVVPFQVVLTNHSNTDERFNLSGALDGTASALAGNAAFPAGTTFSFYSASGSPLLDVDGDGVPDVLVSANSALAIEVRADLPLGYSTAGAAPTNAGDIPVAEVTATSSSDATVSNSTVLLLGDIVGSEVDLENAGGLADGSANTVPDDDLVRGAAVVPSNAPAGYVDTTTAWTTDFVNPGDTASFTLVVENPSLAPDSYNLFFSDSDFVSGSLPADWLVVFRNSSNAIVTNTGLIAAGGSETFTAEVTIPEGQAPGGFDLYFRAISATNAAVVDTKMDQVVVNEVADLLITPDREGDLSAGGVLALSHTLTNVGNVDVTEGAITSTGFPTLDGTLYLDDGDGVLELDGSDIIIDNVDDIGGGFVLAPGDSVTIFNRVQASASAVAGLSESATITVATSLNSGDNTDFNSGNNDVTNIVTVISGDLELLKEQAHDANCDGIIDAGETFGTAQLALDPGECIHYRVTAENTGTLDAGSVQIIDSTPAFTTQQGAAAAIGGSAVVMTNEPGDGLAGDVISDHGTLIPGAQAVLTFTVEIDS